MGHASEVVRKYKTTSDDLLKVANKTVSGNVYQLPAKHPVSVTQSCAPDLKSPPPKVVKFEPLEPLSHTPAAKPTVCQYYKSWECPEMGSMLHKIDEKIKNKWLKKVKLLLKYNESK